MRSGWWLRMAPKASIGVGVSRATPSWVAVAAPALDRPPAAGARLERQHGGTSREPPQPPRRGDRYARGREPGDAAPEAGDAHERAIPIAARERLPGEVREHQPRGAREQ